MRQGRRNVKYRCVCVCECDILARVSRKGLLEKTTFE